MKKNKKQRAEAKVANVPAPVTPKVEDKTKTVKPKAEKKGETPAGPKKEQDMKKLNAQSALNVTKKITEKKDLKYKYPADVDDLAKRKKFRAEVRRKIESHRKEIAKLMDSGLPEDKVLLEKKTKVADSYLKKVLVQPS